MLLGLAVLLAIGICLGGISFLTAKHTHGLAEGIPGLFYVFCGVLFPLSILPSWGQAIGKAIPLTYWFDITRRLLAPRSGSTARSPAILTSRSWPCSSCHRWPSSG